MTKPRVMQVMAGAEKGGAEAFFERLTLGLARVGIPERALIRNNPARAALLRDGGVDVRELRFGGWLDVLTPRAIKMEIPAWKPNIVLSWMSRAARMVPVSRGVYVHVARLGGYYDLKYYKTCDHLIGNTPDIVAYLVSSGWPKDRAHYLPNFVDATSAPPASRAGLGVPDGVPLVLGLGRLHENKAFDVLIRAMTRVPEAHLVIAGEGPRRGDLLALARHLGVADRVHLVGWREDVAALLAAADVFVCSSRHEPLGNVVIEGWAHRMPVVAARAQGPSILIEDGRTGILAPIDDAGALGEGIAAVLADAGYAARLGAAGRQAYEDRFTEEKVVAQYLDFFSAITARGQG